MIYKDYLNHLSDYLINPSPEKKSSLMRDCKFDHHIELYAQFIFSHYKKALMKFYARFDDVFKPDWHQIMTAYLMAQVPNQYELNQFCFGFVEWLEAHAIDFNLPQCTSDFAKYERAEFLCYLDQEKPNKLSTLQVNPCLQIINLNWNIAEFIQSFETNKAITLTQEKNVLVIARHPETFRCHFTKMDQLIFELLSLTTPDLSLLSDEQREQLINQAIIINY